MPVSPLQGATWFEERRQNVRRRMFPKWKSPGCDSTVRCRTKCLLLPQPPAGPRQEQPLPPIPGRKFRENFFARFGWS